MLFFLLKGKAALLFKKHFIFLLKPTLSAYVLIQTPTPFPVAHITTLTCFLALSLGM